MGDGSVILGVVGVVCLRRQLSAGSWWVVSRFLIQKWAIPFIPGSFSWLVLLMVAVRSLFFLDFCIHPVVVGLKLLPCGSFSQIFFHDVMTLFRVVCAASI